MTHSRCLRRVARMARAAAAEMNHPRSREISVKIAREFEKRAESIDGEPKSEPPMAASRNKQSS